MMMLPFLVIFRTSMESGPFALERRSDLRAFGCELGMEVFIPSKKTEISFIPFDLAC